MIVTESVSKSSIISALEAATRQTKKGAYSKGAHSFEILEIIDPAKVRLRSLWADRFITLLSEKMLT